MKAFLIINEQIAKDYNNLAIKENTKILRKIALKLLKNEVSENQKI